jgi:subtilisin family serine protease
LSTIAGYAEGKLIGPAFGASYVLARTENDASETPLEEDNWIAAIEWADSLGIDIATTSLGYLAFDDPYGAHTWQDMNGNTTLITRAADMAVARGIVVLNAAGNDGFNAMHNTLLAPGDGDSVITVGGVWPDSMRYTSSSVGPTTSQPPRIKPDVMALGAAVWVAATGSTTHYGQSAGTSFACPLTAGVVALLLQACPSATPMQIRDVLRQTASHHDTPDNQHGWGVVNATAALAQLRTAVQPTSLSKLKGLYR